MRAKIRAQGAEMVSKRRPLVPPTACGTCFRVHLKQEINQIDSNAVLVSHITKKQATAAEISGGITLDNIRAYAQTGADFVSSGAITHSARAVDISFRLVGQVADLPSGGPV